MIFPDSGAEVVVFTVTRNACLACDAVAMHLRRAAAITKSTCYCLNTVLGLIHSINPPLTQPGSFSLKENIFIFKPSSSLRR
jgi:hypothetical protein